MQELPLVYYLMRLRDDLFDGKILIGMIRRGGNELQKGSVGNLSKLWGFRGADSQLELYGRKAEEQTGAIRQLLNGKARVVTIGTKAKHENVQQQKTFSNSHRTYDLNIYIVGAGA